MKALRIAAILLFAFIFTYSITCFLWRNFTPDGKQWQQEHTRQSSAMHHSFE